MYKRLVTYMIFLDIFSPCRNIIFIAKIGKQINAFPLERRKLFHIINLRIKEQIHMPLTFSTLV